MINIFLTNNNTEKYRAGGCLFEARIGGSWMLTLRARILGFFGTIPHDLAGFGLVQCTLRFLARGFGQREEAAGWILGGGKLVAGSKWEGNLKEGWGRQYVLRFCVFSSGFVHSSFALTQNFLLSHPQPS